MALITGNGSRNILNGTNGIDAILGFGGNDDLFGLGGSRETEKSLWKDVLPIVNCAPKIPCIQKVAHMVASSGNRLWPVPSNAPWRRRTRRSLSRRTTWRLWSESGTKKDKRPPSVSSCRRTG
jgi:Ca2+-binding RTX toxin-like protein